MDNEKKYYAFISYKREDEKWAKWLQHKLEHYKLPSNLNGRNDLPKEIRPIFRDQSELAGGVLADEINKALTNSKYLIVICSPRAAQSQWVGKEVQTFIDLGRTDRIIPFIIGGTAHAQNPEEECFPLTLLNLPPEQELLGINIDEMGRDAAAVKVVAQMFGLGFDVLWQRYERENRRRRVLVIVAALLLASAGVGVSVWFSRLNKSITGKNIEIIKQKDEIEERNKEIQGKNERLHEDSIIMAAQLDSINRRDALIELQKDSITQANQLLITERDNLKKANWKMMENNYRFVAKNAERLIELGENSLACRIAVEVLPINLKHSDTPFVVEGERLLRKATRCYYQIVAPCERKLIREVSEEFPCQAVFSPNGNCMAYSYGDYIYIWDMNKEVITDTLDIQTNQGWNCVELAFSNDGKWLKTYDYSTNKIWDMETMKCVDSNILNNSMVFERKIQGVSPDGEWEVTTGRYDSVVYVENININSIGVKCFVGHTKSVTCATFTPDGKQLVSGSKDGTIRVWDFASGTCENVLIGHDAAVVSVDVSVDGKYIASTSLDLSVRIWPLRQENSVIKMEKRRIDKIQLGDNGVYVMAEGIRRDGDSLIYIYEINEMKTINIFNNTAWYGSRGRAISTDLNKLVITNVDGKEFDKYGRPKKEVYLTSVLDIKSGDTISICESQCAIEYNCFTHDSKRIVSVSYDGMLIVWNVNDGKIEKMWPLSKNKKFLFVCICISPDDSTIAVSSANNEFVELYSFEGELLGLLTGHSDVISGISYSNDGRYIVTGSYDCDIRIWDSKSFNCLKPLHGHSDIVSGVLFNLNSDYVVSTSVDNTMCIWSVKTGECVEVLPYSDIVKFSHDGQRIICSNGDDASIHIWDFLPLQDLIDQTRERFKDRPLTPEERHQYYLE